MDRPQPALPATHTPALPATPDSTCAVAYTGGELVNSRIAGWTPPRQLRRGDLAMRFESDAAIQENKDVTSAEDMDTLIARLHSKITNTLLSVRRRAGLSSRKSKMQSALPELASAPQRVKTCDMPASRPSQRTQNQRRSLETLLRPLNFDSA